MDLELAGKVAVVTGGSRGIGYAIARELAMEGCDLAIVARTADQLQKAAARLAAESERVVVPVVADISDKESVDAMVAEVVRRFARIDILVNDAGAPGGLAGGPLESVTDEAMLEDLNTKYMGYLRCPRAVAPHMKRQGWGRIIHIGGLSARSSGSYSAGARNIAIVHLSKTISDELGPYGITSNVVHPSGTRTPWFDQNVQRQAQARGVSLDEMEKLIAQNQAIRRIVDAKEIAYVVAFLASPKSAAITGEVISGGGGASRAVTT